MKLLELQVNELQMRLKAEEERDDICKICFTKQIDTVFLECAHRISCYQCSADLKRVSSLYFSVRFAGLTFSEQFAHLMYNLIE